MNNPRIVGIDLGTTNSLVAVTEEGVPRILADRATRETLLPSVVYFPTGGGAPVVGSGARQYLVTNPSRAIYSAKRLMGKGHADVEAETQNLSYSLVPERGDVATINLGSTTVTAP